MAETSKTAGASSRSVLLSAMSNSGNHRARAGTLHPVRRAARKILDQWDRPAKRRLPLEKPANDGGNLYRASYIYCSRTKINAIQAR